MSYCQYMSGPHGSWTGMPVWTRLAQVGWAGTEPAETNKQILELI